MIKVLIVEDSDVISMMLKAILDAEPDIQVIGRARTGYEAIVYARQLNPDLITMDIRMPEMDGLTAIQEIMSTAPKAIVVISSNVDDELQIGFRAIDEGALAVLEKPCAFGDMEFASIHRAIVDTVRAMAEVRLVKRINYGIKNQRNYAGREQNSRNFKMVAIASSTGGPQALKQILSALPESFSLPIVIVQHISRGFVKGMVSWLSDHTPLKLKIADDEEVLLPGTVYFAPDDYHCLINKTAEGLQINLNRTGTVNGFRPSATPMLQSVALACPNQAIGVILSGMGCDGAEGLLSMRRQGCMTLVQNESTSIVFGMPSAALAIDAVDNVLAIENIAHHLIKLTE